MRAGQVASRLCAPGGSQCREGPGEESPSVLQPRGQEAGLPLGSPLDHCSAPCPTGNPRAGAPQPPRPFSCHGESPRKLRKSRPSFLASPS